MTEVSPNPIRKAFNPARLVLASVLCFLVVTACGGGSGIGTGGAGATDGDDEVSSTAGSGGSAETTSSSVSDGDEGSPSEPAGESGQDAEFCVWIRANAADDTDFSDPVATEESMKRNLAEAGEIISEVPGELADDFEVVYQSMVATEAAFAENGYSLFAIPEGVLEGIATDEVIAASANISQYCGAGL